MPFVHLVFIPDASLSAFRLKPGAEVSLPALLGPLSRASPRLPEPHLGSQPNKDATTSLSHLLPVPEPREVALLTNALGR